MIVEPAVPVEDRVRVAPDVELRTVSWGRPRPDVTSFLLVHGLSSNAHLWDGVGAELAARGRHGVAVDLRGHGRSDRPDGGYDFATVVSDLIAVMEHHHLGRPIVCGQSWGGNVVVELAWSHPRALRGVVAVDGGLIELGSRFERWEDCREALAPPMLAGTPKSRFEALIRSANPDWPEAGIQGVLASFDVDDHGGIHPRLSRERHFAILEALYHHRPSQRFAEITVPVMFVLADSGDVAWTHDKSAAADRAVAALARGRVEWFRPAHHDLHAQHPQRLTNLVLSALDEGFWP
jgi:pimeloyl-ACP methyl ester carboxylesterase